MTNPVAGRVRRLPPTSAKVPVNRYVALSYVSTVKRTDPAFPLKSLSACRTSFPARGGTERSSNDHSPSHRLPARTRAALASKSRMVRDLT